jgi:hypothetical protein
MSDQFLRAVFNAGMRGTDPPRYAFTKAPEWDDLMERMQRAYMAEVEQRLRDGFRRCLGHDPTGDEVRENGRKVCYIDGSVEYFCGKVCILRIAAPKIASTSPV